MKKLAVIVSLGLIMFVFLGCTKTSTAQYAAEDKNVSKKVPYRFISTSKCVAGKCGL